MTASDFSPAGARRPAVIEVTPDAPEALRMRIAKALNDEGAWCGVCDYEGGLDGCSECRKTVLAYADRAIRVVTEDARR